MRRIDLDGQIPLPPSGVLKAHVVASLLSAERIEQEARRRAEQEMRRIGESAEETERASRQAGYAEGLEAFAAAARELNAARSRLCERVETLLRECLQHILGRMPKEALLEATLGSVIGELRQGLDIAIMVHPANLPALDRAMTAYRASRDLPVFFRSEPNDRMSPDQCLVYAGADVIDISVSVIVEEMLGALQLSRTWEATDAR